MNMQFTKSAEMSLSDATKPLLVVSRLIGINPKSHWHKIYTGIILVCDLTLFWLIWQIHFNRGTETSYFQRFVHGTQAVCSLILILFIWGSSLFDRKRFMIPLRDFAKIDESLKGLGGSTDNKGTYSFQIVHAIIFGLILICLWPSEISFHSPAVTNKQIYGTVLLGLFYHSTVLIVSCIMDCSFSVTLSLIKNRFEVINSTIRRIGTHEWHSVFNFPEVSRAHDDNDVIRALRVLRNRYHDLWEIAYQINDAYGLYLFVGMINSFTLMTARLYRVHSKFSSGETSFLYALAGNINWIVLHVMRILVLAQACESTVAEAKATSAALHKLRMEGNHSPVMKEEIRDFLTQLQFEARNFTAYKFFDVNFSLVCAILGTACTYLVILVQMGDSSSCVIVNCNGSLHFGN